MSSFLRSTWLLARQDLVLQLKQKETLLWTFLMPVLFFWFIGTVTSGFGGSPSSDRRDALGVSGAGGAGFLGEALEARLADQRFDVRHPSEEHPFHEQRRRLALPEGMTDAALSGSAQELRYESEAEGFGDSLDRFRIQRAVATLLADLAVLTAEGTEPSAESLAGLAAEPRSLEFEVRPARRAGPERIPTGFEQAVPGTMVMFALIVLLTGGATTLLAERREGMLRRLASAPIPRGAVVAGKWLGKLSLAAVQIGFAMLLGRVAFGVHWGPHLLAVLGLLLAYAALLSSAALCLGNAARTEAQAVGIGVLLGNVLAALGGCWWPIEITPTFMQRLATWLPTGWTMDGLHKLVSFGMPPASVVPHVLAHLVGALVLGAWVARRFRFA